METIINSPKDIVSLTYVVPTDIAALGLWDVSKLQWVDSSDAYFNKFNNVFEQDVEEIKDSALITETNGDGDYRLTIKVKDILNKQQEEMIYRKVEGVKFTTSGICRFGSPEYVGYKDQAGVNENMTATLKMTAGTYIADMYSLLTRDEKGEPEYMEYMFCLWPEDEYPGDKTKLQSLTKAQSLKYHRE